MNKDRYASMWNQHHSLAILCWLILLFLVGCSPITPIPSLTPTIHPFTLSAQQITLTVAPTILPITATIVPTSTSTLAITITPLSTATQTPLATLRPESVKETMQPFLQDPMNCVEPCFLGITPGKTSLDKVRAFVDTLGLPHREGTDPNSGRDFYSFGYETSIGPDASVIIYTTNNLVENIEITPEITKQTDGSPRDWIGYSPETLIKKYGKPSRVAFGVDLQQLITITMIMYFDQIDLIALYSGIDRTLQLCPFTYPFDYVRLWMGSLPPNRPSFETVSLEKATGLTIDQFTQLMLGDPQNACFNLNEDVYH